MDVPTFLDFFSFNEAHQSDVGLAGVDEKQHAKSPRRIRGADPDTDLAKAEFPITLPRAPA